MILCADPKAQYLARKEKIDEAIRRVLDSGWYINGPEVAAFEMELAHSVGTAHALGVGNGTEAIHLALVALGVKAGDEVVTVSHTAVATVAAIRQAAATPVFADVDPISMTMSPKSLEQRLSSRTKAIVVVHLYGCPADMDAILAISNRYGIPVVEDCAQAQGATHRGRSVGSLGAIGCFSFYPTKNLGALGDGGAVTSSDTELYARCKMLREYGWDDKRNSQSQGWNTRLDELQAAILRAKLPFLAESNNARVRIAATYRAALGNLPLTLPHCAEHQTHVYHLFVLRTTKRDKLLAHLHSHNIMAGVHYTVPAHLQPGFANASVPLPETEQAVMEVLSLPMYPELSETNIKTVTRAVREFHSSGANGHPA
jgi:dTDP-4-amino-4,6-dideoxygalactose transaminase